MQAEIAQFNKTFKKYCEENNRDSQIAERALTLFDEMKQANEAKLLSWLSGEGKTLLLQENLRETTYCGNKGDNSKGTLLDFNAFALLDTVSLYNKRNWDL